MPLFFPTDIYEEKLILKGKKSKEICVGTDGGPTRDLRSITNMTRVLEMAR